MTLNELKMKASKEHFSIEKELTKIAEARRRCPRGTDLIIEATLIPKIISFCDLHEIPVYHVTENCVSTAATYAQLVVYEDKR